MSNGTSKPPASAAFATTRWTLVLAAADARTEAGREALEQLCRTYWFPLYAFVRHRGYDAHTAQDLTQGFFARLLDGDRLAGIRREGGRFRAYLLTAIRHYLANEHERTAALRRGGGAVPLSLDEADADARYQDEPSHHETPDRVFERQWALTLMEQALETLAAEQQSTGRTRVFTALRPFLSRNPDTGEYAALAADLGMAAGTIAVQVHRLRDRYRQIVRTTVADTVDSPLEVDDELRHLLATLGSS